MSNYRGYLTVLFMELVSRVPFCLLYRISDLIFFFIYYVIRYRKKVVLKNLQRSFPEKTKEEINRIAIKYYRHMADLMVESIKIHGMSKQSLQKRVKYLNPEVFCDLYDKNKKATVLLAHYGNWEWLTGMTSISKHSYVVIYKPIHNPVIDRFMKKTRTKFGMEGIPMENSYRMIMSQPKEKSCINGFIADQSPLKSKFWTTFLNQETAFFPGAEKIACKQKTPVFFAEMKKEKRGYYSVRFIKICDDASQAKEYEVTQMYVRMLEKMIIEKPEYWLWSHRRWKRKRPAGIPLKN